MDLVKWLRVHATGDDFSDDLMEQAANEIERLREDRDRLANLAIDNAKDTERAMRYEGALTEIAYFYLYDGDYSNVEMSKIARDALKDEEE